MSALVNTSRSSLNQAMLMLAEQPGALFIGQGVCYPGHALYHDLDGVPAEQRIEMPVAEELQMGICTGLAIQGFLPISIYPRMDFLLRAMDQLVNHLDKMEQMSQGQFYPKVIIRTRVGQKHPLDAGPQHTQNHVETFAKMLPNMWVSEIRRLEDVAPVYERATRLKRSMLIVESLC